MTPLGKSVGSEPRVPMRSADPRTKPQSDIAHWFETPLGTELIREARESVSRLVPPGYYPTGFQVGLCRDSFLQSAENAYYGVPPQGAFHIEEGCRQFECLAEQLPFGARSIDLLALPFTLEFSTDPHAVLREVNSVLAPEGCLVVCGFNRWGLWGLRRALSLRPRQGPWGGSFLSLNQIQDWTRLLGLDLVAAASMFYRPPIKSAPLLNRTSFLEAAGDRWWPLLSGAFVLVAKKRAFAQSTILEPVRASRQRGPKPFASALPRQVANRKLRL